MTTPGGILEHFRQPGYWLYGRTPGKLIYTGTHPVWVELFVEPDGQTLQLVAPSSSVYFPSEHGRHVPFPKYPLVPAGHGVQAETEVAPCIVWVVPFGQTLQLVAPSSSVYFPSEHGRHVPFPKYPLVPAGHGVQASMEVAPVVVVRVPAGHILQFTVPSVSAYRPAAHT